MEVKLSKEILKRKKKYKKLKNVHEFCYWCNKRKGRWSTITEDDFTRIEIIQSMRRAMRRPIKFYIRKDAVSPPAFN